MNKMKRFLAPIKETPLLFFVAFCVYLFWGLNGVVHVLFLQVLTGYLETGNQDAFFTNISYYVFYIVIFQVLHYLTRNYSWPKIVNQAIINIQKKYIKKFINLDNNKVEGIGTGKMVAIMKGGIDMWGRLIFAILEKIPQVLLTFIFTTVMLCFLNPWYGVIFILLYSIFHIIAHFFNSKVLVLRNARTKAKALYTKDFVKVLMSKFEILQSDKTEKEIETLNVYQKNITQCNEKISGPMNFSYQIPEFGMDLVLLFVFVYFGKEVFAGSISMSTFVGISGMIILMKNAIGQSIDVFKNFTKEFVEVEALWKLFDETKNIPGYETGTDFAYKNGEIQIQNLTFAYENTKQHIFENFSLHISGGKTTAFVGASGSGKSTLLKLIAGYMHTQTGEIRIDNQKLSEVALKSYYKHVGYLTQDPSVFDGTILDNLTYAIDSTVEHKKLDEVIRLAKCEFIYDFADGLETQVGERGIKLSGGQKQRLAIAKILLKNPKMILLDEPTSALDSFSEDQITIALNNLFKNRTVIIIAHRLQTVKNADMIYVFEDGEVVENGKHYELVEKGGIYNKLLELQSGI